ncbi:helix-turn-helix domain-containing protein [Marinoscillum sp.]|uniref:helix-turn-helix domain-containing protein n=1 Tax=Marinoscillum sp. TaxID=2024838 RepID=UPI003BAC3DFB
MEESEIIKSFGRVLKEIREEKGFTQERLANESESHFTHISRLENGHKQPTLTTLFRLAEILKVEPEDFILRMKYK